MYVIVMSRRCVCNDIPTESCPFVSGGRGVARRDGDAAEEALEVDEVCVLPPQSRGGLGREEVWGSAMIACIRCWNTMLILLAKVPLFTPAALNAYV